MLRWLSICRHRVRGYASPYFLVLQHHFVESDTRIVAPLAPSRAGSATLLAPEVSLAGDVYRVILLNMTPVRLNLLGPAVEAEIEEDDILRALDAIFRGYPVGLPIG